VEIERECSMLQIDYKYNKSMYMVFCVVVQDRYVVRSCCCSEE
jgi:hypothetical protein